MVVDSSTTPGLVVGKVTEFAVDTVIVSSDVVDVGKGDIGDSGSGLTLILVTEVTNGEFEDSVWLVADSDSDVPVLLLVPTELLVRA